MTDTVSTAAKDYGSLEVLLDPTVPCKVFLGGRWVAAIAVAVVPGGLVMNRIKVGTGEIRRYPHHLVRFASKIMAERAGGGA